MPLSDDRGGGRAWLTTIDKARDLEERSESSIALVYSWLRQRIRHADLLLLDPGLVLPPGTSGLCRHGDSVQVVIDGEDAVDLVLAEPVGPEIIEIDNLRALESNLFGS